MRYFTNLYDLNQVKNFIQTLPEFEEKEVVINGIVRKDYKAIVLKNTNKVVSIVSSKYQLVQNKDIFNRFIYILENHFKKQNVKGFCYNVFSKAYLSVILEESELQGDSKYLWGLMVKNSVDTSLSVGVKVLAIRQICSNGLMGFKEIEKLEIKHSNQNIFQQIDLMFYKILKQFNFYIASLSNIIADLKSKLVRYTEAEKIVNQLIDSKKGRIIVKNEIYGLIDNGYITAFDLYMAITNYYSNKTGKQFSSVEQNISKALKVLRQI